MDPDITLKIKQLAKQYAEETLTAPEPMDYIVFENAILQGWNLCLEHYRDTNYPKPTYPITKKTSGKRLFSQIQLGDLVTIDHDGVPTEGIATGTEHGNWVLVAKPGRKGTWLVTRANVLNVKKLPPPPKLQVGVPIFYDDGRGVNRGIVTEVTPQSMLVQFEDAASPTIVSFNSPQWMHFIRYE